MTARQIKQTLSKKLRNEKQFVGAGVMQHDGKEYVLIRLLNEGFEQLRASIPTQIDGVEIKVEKSEPIIAFSL